ncbi:MAG TPA: universal stress protein [Acidimicrobiia bacterium]|nr:universal stress protein [Acidimicrobiia bacterium]
MKIVVPLDLSEVSTRAIEPAADIARGVGDQVLLVTVAGARLRSDLKSLAESEGTEPLELIQQYLESTASELGDLDVDYQVIPGETAAGALVDFADDQDDLRMIVMATHGRTGVERWRLGNVTEKVVRHATVPVMVVPTRTKG